MQPAGSRPVARRPVAVANHHRRPLARMSSPSFFVLSLLFLKTSVSVCKRNRVRDRRCFPSSFFFFFLALSWLLVLLSTHSSLSFPPARSHGVGAGTPSCGPRCWAACPSREHPLSFLELPPCRLVLSLRLSLLSLLSSQRAHDTQTKKQEEDTICIVKSIGWCWGRAEAHLDAGGAARGHGCSDPRRLNGGARHPATDRCSWWPELTARPFTWHSGRKKRRKKKKRGRKKRKKKKRRRTG